MAEFGGLQLLPQTRKSIDISMPGENRFFYIGLLVILLSAGLYAGVYFYSQSLETQVENLDSDLIALENRRDKANEERLETFSRQAALMSNLLTNHIFWSQALAKLQNLVHRDVQVETLTASLTQRELLIKATALNYTTIARQIAAFTSDDSLVDVEIGDMNSLTSGRLEFSITLKFNEAKLLKKQATAK